MNIEYKAPTIELTDEIREYAEEKVAMLCKLLHAVDDENIRAEIGLQRKQGQQTGSDIFRADITIHAGVDRTHAVGRGETLHAALDEAKDELSRRLRRGKTKRLDSLREGGLKIKKMLRFWE
jgi:ribosomal subunit interface protein|tara:strand:- start:121 stop:486 length:366 start_codon:yes stop_codon:yes gene_type:complete